MEEVRRKYQKWINATELGEDFKDLEEKDQLQLNKKILKWTNILTDLQEMATIETYPVTEKIPNTKPKKYWNDDWETDAEGHWVFREVLNPDGSVKMRKHYRNQMGIIAFLDSQFHTKFLENKHLRSVVNDDGYANELNKPLFNQYVETLKANVNKAVAIFNARETELIQKQKEDMKAYASQEVECGCGGHYSMRNKAKHFETKKHEKWAETQTPIELPVAQKADPKDNPQNKEVECGCGGKYSVRNKLKHFATGKHTKWLEANK
jgi:hypothetical protein